MEFEVPGETPIDPNDLGKLKVKEIIDGQP